MKLNVLLPALLLFFQFFAFSHGNHDEGPYRLVRVFFDAAHPAWRLSQAGVAIDHGQYKKDTWLITVLSKDEFAITQDLGYTVEILSEDAVAMYRNQNQTMGEPRLQNDLACAPPASRWKVPENFTLGSMGGFFTYEEMLAHLDTMSAKWPHLITPRIPIDTFTTHDGYPIYYLRMSNNPSMAEPEPEILYTALHHAREPGSLSQLIFFMYYLLENYNTDDFVRYLVDNTQLYFIPCLNPDGYLFNQINQPWGGGMWRKNMRDNQDGTFGVDLNRNYGFEWAYDNIGSSDMPTSQVYRGPAPFSEPETQAIKWLCEQRNFAIALNYHTFGNLLIHPYAYLPGLQTPDSSDFRAFARAFVRENNYLAGLTGQTVGYGVNGSSDDWMYGEQTTKMKIYAFTPEVGESFWPPATDIIPHSQKTLFMNLAAAHMTLDFVNLEEESPPIIETGSGFIRFGITKYGLKPNTQTIVSLIPLDSNVVISGGTRIFNNLSRGVTVFDSIPYSILAQQNYPVTVRFLFGYGNGTYFYGDTLVRVIAPTVSKVFDNGDLAANWQGNAWGISTAHYYSAPQSYTNAPGGVYPPSTFGVFELNKEIDLSASLHAYLTFKARWHIEETYDYVQVQAQKIGSNNWIPLCGNFTRPGSIHQSWERPVYDGHQDEWIGEFLSLDDFCGSKILLRFIFSSDNAIQYEGFYFDDLEVRAYDDPSVSNPPPHVDNSLSLQCYLNPAGHFVHAWVRVPDSAKEVNLKAYSVDGRLMFSQNMSYSQDNHIPVPVSGWPSGIYLFRLESPLGVVPSVKMAILK